MNTFILNPVLRISSYFFSITRKQKTVLREEAEKSIVHKKRQQITFITLSQKSFTVDSQFGCKMPGMIQYSKPQRHMF